MRQSTTLLVNVPNLLRERHTEKERDRERERVRETERETERQREIERQRDKETETQRDTERQRDTESTNIGSRIHWEICGPNGIPVKLKWYEHQPEVVIENDSWKILWNFTV